MGVALSCAVQHMEYVHGRRHVEFGDIYVLDITVISVPIDDEVNPRSLLLDILQHEESPSNLHHECCLPRLAA